MNAAAQDLAAHGRPPSEGDLDQFIACTRPAAAAAHADGYSSSVLSIDRVVSADADSEEDMSPARLSERPRRSLSAASSVWPWPIALLVVALTIAGVTLSSQVVGPTGPAISASPSVTSASKPQYPISGYFITANTVASKNREKLTDISAVGGDTAITFGTLLKPVSPDSLPEDCVIDEVKCAEFAAGIVKVHRYFTYSDGSSWHGFNLPCPRDKSFSNNGRAYTILFQPTEGKGCSSPKGTYDVVLVGGSKASAEDPAIALATAATDLDMKFYAGLPAPVKRTDLDYLPDLSYEETLALFTERFLQYQASRNDVAGLAGFYHHIEMPISSNPFFDPVLSLYRMQNEAIRRVLPTRSAIVSPYIESRVDASNVSPDDARLGVRKIAQTSSGIQLKIAIQDGMGTGKGAAYLPSESDTAVDAFAESIVGRGTWGGKYVAPNEDYFRAAAAGVAGTGAELWANLEGMAPATKTNPCGNSLRGHTTLDRIDRQLQQMTEAAKVISFMWDPYFTCDDTSEALRSQMTSGFTTPIVTGASLDTSTGSVRVTGFNLSGGSALVKWTTTDGITHEVKAEVPKSEEKHKGLREPKPKLETIFFELGNATWDVKIPYKIGVANQWGNSLQSEYTDGKYTP